MRILRIICIPLIGLVLAACGGGGGSTGAASEQAAAGGTASMSGTGAQAPAGPQNESVTLSGRVSYDRVPAVAGVGLDYSGIAVAPVRAARVEILSGPTVVATTATDMNGEYSVDVGSDLDVIVRVKAESVQGGAAGWTFSVDDNTNGYAIYAMDSTVFNTGSSDLIRDLHAASGWGGSSYTGPRAAAPFAILDVLLDAALFVRGVDSGIDFPPLAAHWSPDNVPELPDDGFPDLVSGEIGSSFFSSSSGSAADGIYLLGAEDQDTDEFDRHVILHEWGHYLEASFSRSDSIGGAHAIGDLLDMRVAFGEGFGNAFSAMASGDDIYTDAQGFGQGLPFSMDIEGPLGGGDNPGWYSEASVQEILYDLFDANRDVLEDDLSLGFAPIYAVLTGDFADSVPLTTIFSFVDALKRARPDDAIDIDRLVQAQSIDPVADGYGSGEANAPAPSAGSLLPVYKPLPVDGRPVEVCSTNDFPGHVTGATNKLGSRAYLKFAVQAAGPHTITATTTSMPAGKRADPDIVLHQRGVVFESDGPPAADCVDGAPDACLETFTVSLTAGDYVLDVHEWTNTNSETDPQYPPIGATCFDVEVARQ